MHRSGDLLAKIAAVDPPAESAVTSVANHGVTVVIPSPSRILSRNVSSDDGDTLGDKHSASSGRVADSDSSTTPVEHDLDSAARIWGLQRGATNSQPHHHVAWILYEVASLGRLDGAWRSGSHLGGALANERHARTRPRVRGQTRTIKTHAGLARVPSIRNAKLGQPGQQGPLVLEIGSQPRRSHFRWIDRESESNRSGGRISRGCVTACC